MAETEAGPSAPLAFRAFGFGLSSRLAPELPIDVFETHYFGQSRPCKSIPALASARALMWSVVRRGTNS